jgi:FkbM family methyltransferase
MKSSIQGGLRRIGWELRRTEITAQKRLVDSLHIHNIELVLDVGANIGQFGKALRVGGYKGKILSFEPQTEAHKLLLEASRGDIDWQVAPRSAVGRQKGSTQINLSKNSVSSSLLPMRDGHLRVERSSKYFGSENVDVVAIDDLNIETDTSKIFLKIDTQGYEMQVLEGASKLLDNGLCGLQVEISLTSLYDGQASWAEIFNFLHRHFFSPWLIEQGFEDRLSGRLLQIDATFYRDLVNRDPPP